eukprot:m.210722 g.210722  ORF g.210722 m.210722 type:complete len:432 (+) comp25261_c0_seq1:98-1393(+)
MAAGPRASSSFQRRGARTLPPGTTPSRQNAQLLTSTGIPSLDVLLGGGLAVGAMMVVQEDTYRMYSRTVLKLFLSEGLACGHALALASADRDPHAITRALYPEAERTPTTSKSAAPPTAPSDVSEPMTIAWRYRNAGKVNTEVGASGAAPTHPGAQGGRGSHVTMGRDFDVSKSVEQDQLDQANVLVVDVRSINRAADAASTAAAAQDDNGHHTDHNDTDDVDINTDTAAWACLRRDPTSLLPAHRAVLDQVALWLDAFAVQRPVADGEHRTVARVVIESLGSPLWCTDSPEAVSTVRLLHSLRAMVRKSLAVLCVTIPVQTLSADVRLRVQHLSDVTIKLDAFAGTPDEHSPILKEYHGFVRLLKLPRLNTLTCYYPDTLDLAFKLRRKKFVIERVHLPPDLSETVSRTQGAAPKHAATTGTAAAAVTDW